MHQSFQKNKHFLHQAQRTWSSTLKAATKIHSGAAWLKPKLNATASISCTCFQNRCMLVQIRVQGGKFWYNCFWCFTLWFLRFWTRIWNCPIKYLSENMKNREKNTLKIRIFEVLAYNFQSKHFTQKVTLC